MSLKDKMANAKEVDLFEDLTQEEKIEAIVEGRLQVAMIKELEKIRNEVSWIAETTIDRNTGIAYCRKNVIYRIIDKHISELKGENK